MRVAQKTLLVAGATAFALCGPLRAAEFHVAIDGGDADAGTAEAPFATIQHAANLAQPGDVITVHQGVYRERINPPRGGGSDGRRIVYQAAPGERVEIKGSEAVTDWEEIQGGVWKATLPNSFFAGFNPYNDLIHGDWFNAKGREHHTGAVYLNGEWLTEAASLGEVLKPAGSDALWFGQADDSYTTIWAQFRDVNPNEQLVEINVRQTVFYPDRAGRNYLTVRGFLLSQAATPWAPPTAEQIGLIGTHWSKGWIIEDNVVSHSICSGIALGKHGDEFDNTSADSAEGYVKTIERALAHPIAWSKENIGSHIVRNNTISHCEQAGIVGSMGCAFSSVTGNTIHDIHVRQPFGGAEMGGIKFHGAIDTQISRNHIYRTTRGLWLDWMAQGARVSANLFHHNQTDDLFLEVDHGPLVVDNNIFLSPVSLLDISQGAAFVHNLFAGKIVNRVEQSRETPFHPAHSTRIAGLAKIEGGDNRLFNNIFAGRADASIDVHSWIRTAAHAVGSGPSVYDERDHPSRAGGNIHLQGARPYESEQEPVVAAEFDPEIKLVEKADGWYLEISLDQEWASGQTRPLVTTALLGKAVVPDLPYENPDGTALTIDTDYFGNQRGKRNPFPGPFAKPVGEKMMLKVW